MRRLPLLLTVVAVALAAVAWSTSAQAAGTSLRNPVVPQTASGDDTPDPWIFRHGGRYWLTYTSTDHIELRSARTLAGLAGAEPKRLWPAAGQAEPADRCCQLWAPEIHRLRGPDGFRWYVYYAATTAAGGNDHRMYVLESAGDDPGGPYRFKGQLQLPDAYAIDGTVAQVGGRTYLVYSGGATVSPTALSIVALSNPWTVGGAPLVISRPTLPWETIALPINEGPEVLVHDGRLHVIYSASWCGTGAYALGRLTVPATADLLAPATWEGAKVPVPVFAASAAQGVYGPGHGSFFTSPDGRESWMVYHATERDIGCFTGGLRTTRAQPFTWDADGSPQFGTPVSLTADVPAPGGDGTIARQVEALIARSTRAARTRIVDDRRLFGYRGVVMRPSARAGELPALRPWLVRGGRYRVFLRVLGGPAAGRVTLTRADGSAVTRSARRGRRQAVELDFGVRALRARENVLRLRSTAAITVDQLRLERAR